MMREHADRIFANKNKAANIIAAQYAIGKSAFQLQDNRPKSIIQKKKATSLVASEQKSIPVQKKAANNTLPLQLKSGSEKLSGHSVVNSSAIIQLAGKWGLGALAAIGGSIGAYGGMALSSAAGLVGGTAIAATGGLALVGAGTAYLGYHGVKKALAWNSARRDTNAISAAGRPQLANRVRGVNNLNERAWMANITRDDNQHVEGGAGVLAGALPNPRMRFQLTPDEFVRFNVAPRNADPHMHFDAATNVVTSTYNPQQLLEIDNVLYMDRLQHLVPDLDPGEHTHNPLNRAFGSTPALQQEQQNRVALLHDSHQRVNNYDPAAFDAQFNNAALNAHEAQLNAAVTGNAATHYLLNTMGHEGIALGEDHGAPETRHFLANQMQDLSVNKNVNTVYMEHIRHDYQPIIDQWLTTPPGTAMPRALDAFVTRFDANMGGGLRNILVQAHLHGVRVRSIDALASQSALPGKRDDANPLRAITMNVFGEQQIRADAAARAGGKYVIIAGAAHNNTQPRHNQTALGGFNKGLPGFSQLLNIPAVEVNAGGTLSLDREHRQNRR